VLRRALEEEKGRTKAAGRLEGFNEREKLQRAVREAIVGENWASEV
jgi:hypothetical protein